MSITAKVLADSVSPTGARIATLVLRYPRFILAEFNTHRMLSRNSASSRAIPTSKYIAELEASPVYPAQFGRNCKGMQAKTLLEDDKAEAAKRLWIEARQSAAYCANKMAKLGVHKQVVNRILEPFVHADTVATGDIASWHAFLRLRLHEDAQPEIRELAVAVNLALSHSVPTLVGYEGWHTPFAYAEAGEAEVAPKAALMRSVARCARVSYRLHDGTSATQEADDKLAQKLMESGHWSPFEHQAEPLTEGAKAKGNLGGWRQLRGTLEASP